jgi:hypothetical protein
MFRTKEQEAEARNFSNETFKKIDQSFLPKNIKDLESKGLRVEFFEDGQLKQLAIFSKGGTKLQSLDLDHGVMSGISGNSDQYDRYSGGSYGRVDAWSDYSFDTPCSWVEWVKKEIHSITEMAAQRSSSQQG